MADQKLPNVIFGKHEKTFVIDVPTCRMKLDLTGIIQFKKKVISRLRFALCSKNC